MGWPAYFLGPFDALLPKRWRFVEKSTSARFMARSTMISGIIESVVALLVLRYWYMTVLGWISDAYVSKALSKDPGWTTYTPPEYVGGAGFMLIAGNPITWIILYFGLEGVVRLTAAAIAGQSFGSLPLCVIDFVVGLATRSRGSRELPLVPDEILRGNASCDLRIASCQKRPDWEYPFTIRYEGVFFQVIGLNSLRNGPRPYIYSLRRLPLGERAKGLRDYHPDDVLRPVVRLQSLG